MTNMGRVDKTESIRVLAKTPVRLKNLHTLMSPHGTYRKSQFSLRMSAVGRTAEVVFETENVAV